MTAATPAPPPAAPFATGAASSRLRDPLVLGAFAGVFVALVVVAVLAVTVADPGAPDAPCETVPCPPPEGPPRLVTGTPWRSAELGFELEYDSGYWRIDRQSGSGVELVSEHGRVSIAGARGADAKALYDRRVAELEEKLPDLAANRRERTLFGPNVGYRDGPGAAYCGTVMGPQGANERLDLIVMAASNGQVSAVVSVETEDCNKPAHSSALYLADVLLNTFRWPGGP